MIAAYKARQVEGLAGGVHGRRPHPCVLADGLGGDVPVAVQQDIGPDLVRHDVNVVFSEQLHGLFDLPSFPDPSAGVVGRTEYRGVDPFFPQLLLHIRKIHTPGAGLVLYQRAQHHIVAVVFQAVGKADIGRRMQQHLVSLGAEYIESADDAPQHAVLIADALRRKPCYAVLLLLPADDGLIVFLRRIKIPESRMLGPFDHLLLHCGNRRKIHIRDPHGNDVKALPGRSRRGSLAGTHRIQGDGVLSPSVHNRCEIIFSHDLASFCFAEYAVSF